MWRAILALLIAVNDPRLCKLMVTAGEEHRFSLFSLHALMEPFLIPNVYYNMFLQKLKTCIGMKGDQCNVFIY